MFLRECLNVIVGNRDAKIFLNASVFHTHAEKKHVIVFARFAVV